MWKYLQTAALVDDPHQCVPYYSMSMWSAHKTQSQSVFVCVCVSVSWEKEAIVTFVQVCRCDITTPLLKNRFPRDHRYGINCALQCAVLVLTRKEENQGSAALENKNISPLTDRRLIECFFCTHGVIMQSKKTWCRRMWPCCSEFVVCKTCKENPLCLALPRGSPQQRQGIHRRLWKKYPCIHCALLFCFPFGVAKALEINYLGLGN